MRAIKTCDECERKMRNHYTYKNKVLCWKCYRKNFTICGGVCQKKAIKKSYQVYQAKDNEKYFGIVIVPPFLIGEEILIELKKGDKKNGKRKICKGL